MTELVLYDLDHSPFAARVRIALRLKGVAAKLAPPPGGTGGAAYHDINPLGLVPVLVVPGLGALPESETIIDWLDAAHPQPPLRPADAAGQARSRLLARLADFHVAPALRTLFEETKRAPDGATVERFGAAVATRLQQLEAWLGDGPLAVGERVDAADCALAPLLFFVARSARLLPADPFAGKLGRYWQAVQTVPAVAAELTVLENAQARRAARRAQGLNEEDAPA
jgi:glutathione S-transferase